MSELDKFLSGETTSSGSGSSSSDKDLSYDVPVQSAGSVTNDDSEESDDYKLNVQVQAHSQAEDVEVSEQVVFGS